MDQLRAFWRAGGTVLFGTDVGYVLDYGTAEEFGLMARAGLGFPDILASLTTNPARRFGLERTAGRIAPGMEADLVVLEGDPARDIGALVRRSDLRHDRTRIRRAGPRLREARGRERHRLVTADDARRRM